MHLAIAVAVELHEDQVPNLHIAPALATELAINVALVGSRRAHVVMDLAAGTAGAGVSHLPEIFLHAAFVDAFFGDANVLPELHGVDITSNVSR